MNRIPASGPAFVKMHGLGNDFVIFDLRRTPLVLGEGLVRAVAERRRGVGCDQVITIEPVEHAERSGAVAFMGVFNSDGSRSAACGNAARCVGALLMAETDRDRLVVDTLAGPTEVWSEGAGEVGVDMGPARLEWSEIPLAAEADTLRLPVSEGALHEPVGVSMGNPHAVFFVPDAEAVDLATLGPVIERHPLFPERVNVETVTVTGPGRLRMRVWERGAGITPACGTGACAALVAAVRRGIAPRRAEVVLDGGTLRVEWRESDGHVVMSGPVAYSFSGRLDAGLVA